MPHYYIDVVLDGLLDEDHKGITLDGQGAAEALVAVTLTGYHEPWPAPGTHRVVSASARDERGVVVCTDTITYRGGPAQGSDDAAVSRAIRAINGTP